MTEVFFSDSFKGCDISTVAATLRASDKAELDALKPGMDYGETLRACVALSVWVRVLMRGAIPMAVTGIIPNGDRTNAPWMVCTDGIDLVPAEYIRSFFLEVIKTVWLPLYAPLRNYVDARQVKSVRFIRWLGFTLEDPEPLGPCGNLFHKFSMKGA